MCFNVFELESFMSIIYNNFDISSSTAETFLRVT